MRLIFFYKLVVFLVVLCLASVNSEVRVKDVAAINGLEDLQLFGYGLVIGLSGTGDKTQTVFTTQTINNMLKNMGIELHGKNVRVRNVAAVMVTGTLNPFKHAGTRMDVTVSSIGDAQSIEGGTLLMTPLQASDGNVYATAQGPLSTGGYDFRTPGLTRVRKNHVVVGRVPDGAIIQREYKFNILERNELALSLYSPDFTSAVSMAKAINEYFAKDYGNRIAEATDASTIKLRYDIVSRDSIKNYISVPDFISQIENITFNVSVAAKVVLNERTGTVVTGGNVSISQVAVTHGGVKVEITNQPEAIQPQPFTLGQTTVVDNPQISVDEKDMDMVVLDSTTTVSDLASALNSLGVSPRDIITIFQAIKEAGALQAKLVVM